MTWSVKGVDYRVSQSTGNFIKSKFRRLAHIKGIVKDIHIVISKDAHDFYVQAQTTFTGHNMVFHVEHRARKLWTALGKIFSKLGGRVLKTKDKYKTRRMLHCL